MFATILMLVDATSAIEPGPVPIWAIDYRETCLGPQSTLPVAMAGMRVCSRHVR